MAKKDVQEYYYTMLNQYLEMKNDLKDFDEALKNGYITEDRLVEVQDEIAKVKQNLERIQYIMWLFYLPNKKSKRKKLKISGDALYNYFKDIGVDTEALKNENSEVLIHLRKELKQFKESK